ELVEECIPSVGDKGSEVRAVGPFERQYFRRVFGTQGLEARHLATVASTACAQPLPSPARNPPARKPGRGRTPRPNPAHCSRGHSGTPAQATVISLELRRFGLPV